MSTIKDLIKFAEGRDPDEPCSWSCWTKDDIDPDWDLTEEEKENVLDQHNDDGFLSSLGYEILQEISRATVRDRP